jgi:hypothetical protein
MFTQSRGLGKLGHQGLVGRRATLETCYTFNYFKEQNFFVYQDRKLKFSASD